MFSNHIIQRIRTSNFHNLQPITPIPIPASVDVDSRTLRNRDPFSPSSFCNPVFATSNSLSAYMISNRLPTLQTPRRAVDKNLLKHPPVETA